MRSLTRHDTRQAALRFLGPGQQEREGTVAETREYAALGIESAVRSRRFANRIVKIPEGRENEDKEKIAVLDKEL
jgi:hypothetical protein